MPSTFFTSGTSAPVAILLVLCSLAFSACRSTGPANITAPPDPLAVRPIPGLYRLVEDFTIEGCVKYGGWEGGECVETGIKRYKAGEIIYAETFFWDDDLK